MMSRHRFPQRFTGTWNLHARSDVRFLAAAALVAVVTWLTVVIAGRSLGPARFTTFSGIWALFFGVSGVLYGYQQEITRGIAAQALRGRRGPRGQGVPVWRVALGVAVVSAGVMTGSAVVWAPRLAPGQPTATAVVLSLGVLVQVSYSTCNGLLGGIGAWSAVAGIIVVEALIRLSMTAGVAGLRGGTALLAVAVVIGTASWPGIMIVRTVRSAMRGHIGDRMVSPLSRVAYSVVVAGCSSFLIAGFPFMLIALQGPAASAETGAVIAALTLGRAPMLVPAAPLTALLMRHTARDGQLRREITWRRTAMMATLMSVVLMASYALGPLVVQTVFGSEYRVSRPFMASVAVSATLILALQLTGTVLIGKARHRRSAVGWLVAVATSATALRIGGSVETRTALALTIGPLSGLMIHVVFMLAGRWSRGPSPASAEFE